MWLFRPETQTYIQKMEAEKAEKAKGQQTDNRSFFAKYVRIDSQIQCRNFTMSNISNSKNHFEVAFMGK